ncbi:uncharacterized protein LOC131434042 [Malaya genurostris]|uniref:uncharacterized protein LOC131434042 n=1 Tax=Malaya genurostris TaxID=325434 RepID=UPI0026F3F68C|nr:uncharacterized protein LOC131434042 [Malaya genurostris]
MGFLVLGHGITVAYLKLLDQKALNDVFSVAKWTSHKHALRKKLSEWQESCLFNQIPSHETDSSQVNWMPEPAAYKHKLLPTNVTYTLLDDILQRNEKGKIVTQFYKGHNNLDSEHRKFLAHTIVDFYIANNMYFPLPDMARFAQLISERFLSEISVIISIPKKILKNYNPRDSTVNKKNPSGLIYDRFHNRNKKALVKSKSAVITCLQALRNKALELPFDGTRKR